MSNEYFRPEKHFAEGNARAIQKQRSIIEHGSRGDLPTFYRFVVIETIFDPAIIDANKISYFEHTLEVANVHLASVLPRNTIIAKRVMTPGTSASVPAMFLFPFFPPAISLPCQPGEHVWVMFENLSGTKNDLGYWMCRIVEPGFVEDANHTHSPRSLDPSFNPSVVSSFEGTNQPRYEFRNGRADERADGRYTIAETASLIADEDVYERILKDTDGSRLSIKEPVPRYKKRPGDVAFEGTNNTLIVLGRDRSGAVASYRFDDVSRAKIAETTPSSDINKPGAGSIDIVVGRGQTSFTGGVEVEAMSISGTPIGHKELGKSIGELVDGEGNPDFLNDRSRVLVAQKTRVDTNFGISGFNSTLGSGQFQGSPIERKDLIDSETGDGAIVIKSDKIRLIARADLEILVTGYTTRDDKGNIVASSSEADYAVLAIKANGDIVFRPSAKGYIKLGGDGANKGLVCSDIPVTAIDGGIIGPPLTTTMGGQFAGSKATVPGDNGPALAQTQAKYANKILVL
jgi:hypothetical protein